MSKQLNTSTSSRVKSALGHASFFALCAGALVLAGSEVAVAKTLGDVAGEIIKSFQNVTRLVTATSYVAGMGFALAGIVKFKAHRDAPTQVPLSAPIVLVAIATCLLFLPQILTTAGDTVFGEGEATAGTHEGFETIGN